MEKGSIRIVLTGPESTGKTTMAKALANQFTLPLVPEYAREFLEKNGPSYTLEDVIEIGRQQYTLERRVTEHALIADTDLINIMVWMDLVFRAEHEAFQRNITNLPASHYLLCTPDIPWEKDPFRENPTDRDRIFSEHERMLQHYNLPYSVIRGTGERRMHQASQVVSKILNRN